MKIFDAIQQVTPCPVTRSTGCQCDRLERINEAEETIKAIAQLEHTVGDVQGAVKFKQKPGQPTIIKGIVKGLTPGKHGFHIHEFGDLSKGCESAGAHYNPDGVEHGSLEQGHVGDLGNIIADKSGTARFQIKAERVELSDVVGRAIVIHAEEDDLGNGGNEESLKTGNAGERVGCGVIRLKEVVEEEYKRKISDKHFDRNQLPQIRRPDIDDSPFEYKEGSISLSKLKPVQSQRVKGLTKQAQNIFLNNEDRPFILDKNGYIINGHHRYDAANMLGLKKVKAIKIDADIEDVMNYFADKSSDREVMPEHYFKKLYEKKLKEKGTRCWKGYTKKGMKTMFGKRVPNCVKNEDVTRLKPQTSGTKYPLFSKENAQKAYEEWYNGAAVDTDIEIVGNDNKLYIIRQNTDGDSQHFKYDDWYLTDADYKPVDFESYKNPWELLYSHSATGYEPIDPHDLDENFAEAEKYLSRNLNPKVADYVKGKKTKLIKVRVADLDDDAEDDRFSRVIDPDPDVAVDLDEPILIDKDGKTILDGFHRVYQAKRVGREFIPAEVIDENFDDDDEIVEYYDEIHPIVISAWKSVYPNVPLKTFDDEDLYMQYTTADEYEHHGGNGKDFYLSLGVQYMGDEEPPMGYVNVGDAYAGNYKGVVSKIIAALYEWLEKQHPNMRFRELGIHMNRNEEAWKAVAQKVGARIEKRGYYENFADGKVKGKSRPGRVKKAGASCKGSVSSLRAKAKKYSGERGKMYHWCANMKSGKS